MAEEKATKVKRKKWFQILSPALFKNELVGEMPVSEPKFLIGKMVSVNLMSLTRDMKKQNTSIKFVITDVKGDKVITEFYGYYINPASVKRLVRKGKERIDVSIVCKTSDNKKVRVMPLMIPPVKVKGSVAVGFRKNAVNYLTSYIGKTTFENVVKDLISGKIQKELKDTLKKVYPIRILEIAKLHIEKEKKPVEKKVEEKIESKEEGEEVKEEREEKPEEGVKREVKEEEIPKEEAKEEEKPEE